VHCLEVLVMQEVQEHELLVEAVEVVHGLEEAGEGGLHGLEEAGEEGGLHGLEEAVVEEEPDSQVEVVVDHA
jgi:hypothetical protein